MATPTPLQERNKILALAEQRINLLYADAYTRALKIAEVKNAINNAMGSDFTFKANKRAEKALNDILGKLSIDLNKLAQNGLKTAKNNGLSVATKRILAVTASSVAKDMSREAVDDVRLSQALGAQLANEKRGGMTVSQRIWNIAQGATKELEIIIQNNMIEGKSADVASREVRQYLNDPRKLFRRVKDKTTGEYKLSKAAQQYHPGRGKYRSSYMNARRLMVSEMNMATQASECAAYASNPLIAGYEIRLSNNHTVKDPNSKNGTLPLHDICDELQGQYPPTFKFTGWHPHCRCSMIPILISAEERRKLAEAKASGKSYQPKGVITDVPDNFKQWLADNQERIATANSVPFFMIDNAESLAQSTSDVDVLYNVFSRNADYKDVERGENNAFKAIHVSHKEHPKDKKTYFGSENITGDMLEKEFVNEAFRDGRQVIMRKERDNATDLDMILDSNVMDLASITDEGYNGVFYSALRRKNHQLRKFNDINKTDYNSVCLYFHDASMFSEKILNDTVMTIDTEKFTTRVFKNVYILQKNGKLIKYVFE